MLLKVDTQILMKENRLGEWNGLVSQEKSKGGW